MYINHYFLMLLKLNDNSIELLCLLVWSM